MPFNLNTIQVPRNALNLSGLVRPVQDVVQADPMGAYARGMEMNALRDQNEMNRMRLDLEREKIEQGRQEQQRYNAFVEEAGSAQTAGDFLGALRAYDPVKAYEFEQELAERSVEEKQRVFDTIKWMADNPQAAQVAAQANPEMQEYVNSPAFESYLNTYQGKVARWVEKTDPTGNVILVGFDENMNEIARKDLGPIGKPASSMSFTTDEQGNVTFTQGPGADMTKAAQNKVDKDMIDAEGRLKRLENIRQSYNSKWLEAGPRMRAEWNKWKAKFDSDSLSPREREELREYSFFFSDAINNVNRTLNELSGAAVSPAEAQRLRAELPDPGNQGLFGILQADDPVSYKAKLDRSIFRVKQALARYQYYRARGLTDPKKIAERTPLTDQGMSQLLDKRGDELEREYKELYPDAKQSDIEALVKRQLKQEFPVNFGG